MPTQDENNTAAGAAQRTITVKGHQVTLLPNGTITVPEDEADGRSPLDIEMLIDGKEYGIGQPLAADFRNADSTLSDEGLRHAALEALDEEPDDADTDWIIEHLHIKALEASKPQLSEMDKQYVRAQLGSDYEVK